MNSITGTAGGDTITGTVADDEIFGGDGNDTITGAAGNDVIYGGKGTDTVRYTGSYSNFRLTALYEGKNNSFSGYTVADTIGSEGVDTVSSDVEYLTFSSGAVIYKIDNGTLSLVDTTAPTVAVTSSGECNFCCKEKICKLKAKHCKMLSAESFRPLTHSLNHSIVH